VLLHVSAYSADLDTLPSCDQAVKILSRHDDPEGFGYYQVFSPLAKTDSSFTFSYLSEVAAKGKSANAYFAARLYSYTVTVKLRYHQFKNKSELMALTQSALNKAYETNDDRFIAFVTFKCGSNSLEMQELELAAYYLVKAQELYDGFHPPVRQFTGNFVLLGEVLFHCHEYEKSIFYTRKAIESLVDTTDVNFLARFYNTIGQDFYKLEKSDSALKYYERSMHVAKGPTHDAWRGINAGYIGELYFSKNEYQKAKPFLRFNYSVNKNAEYEHAAKSLQLLAAIDLVERKNDSALAKIREALALIKKSGSGYYLQPLRFLEQIYYTASDVYRAAGKTDSFYLYNQLYANLHDSLQQVAIMVSAKIARLKIDNENNLRGIQFLQKEKQSVELKRNYILLSMLLISLIAFLYLNRIMLKQKHKRQVAIKDKRATELQLVAAKELMDQFTQNIIEKTAVIEQLSLQLSNKEHNLEDEQMIKDISNQTILTEPDWENFKTLFEKIHPGFFFKLRQKASDITVAEQRMAALTRLNLTSRQMASMLGISVDSVHKTRQRLRHRLRIPVEIDLEDTVATL
jgi:hypothetical protein